MIYTLMATPKELGIVPPFFFLRHAVAKKIEKRGGRF
jgi:hypothetical protein